MAVSVLMALTRKRNVPAILTKIKRIDGKDVDVMPDGAVSENPLPVYSGSDQQRIEFILEQVPLPFVNLHVGSIYSTPAYMRLHPASRGWLQD